MCITKVATNMANMMNFAKVMDLTKFSHKLRFKRMTKRDGCHQSGKNDEFG